MAQLKHRDRNECEEYSRPIEKTKENGGWSCCIEIYVYMLQYLTNLMDKFKIPATTNKCLRSIFQ